MSQENFTDPFLRERYGIRDRNRPAWVYPAIAVAVVGGSWLFWSANHYSHPETRSSLVSFAASDAKSIQVTYSLVFKSKNLAHQCRLIARDYSANVVGELTDSIPAGVSSITRTVAIPTRLKAVNAGIESCRP